VTKQRPVAFKWRQFEPQLILMAVGCYLRFSLSYRDLEELFAGAGHVGGPRHRLAMGSALCFF
jgi:transposase-like protein